MYLRECWKEGAWIQHAALGALVVTSGALAISLLEPSEGFYERRDLEERYKGDDWEYHPRTPARCR
jgi:hypothetical protein